MLDTLLDALRDVEAGGGPRPEQYAEVLAILDAIAQLRGPEANELAISEFLEATSSFSTLDTMQGFVVRRPRGYPGDFEIIDRIYRYHVSARPDQAAWDTFFHAGDAAKAVRARKDYCVALFRRHAVSRPNGARILNVASGPCRDLFEFKRLDLPGVAESHIHCVDMDADAIAFGRALLADYRDTVSFENRNIFRLRLVQNYDLVWSAGLFDYFDDRVFVRLLKRLYDAAVPGGEVVVGNFGTQVNSKSYMELGDWYLNYRSEHALRELAMAAGFSAGQISVGSEENGVNLFLHIAVR
jgi:hypothetical protein